MKKVLRSMILEQFPFDLRVQIELLSRKRNIENKDKQEELFKLLRDANISDITPLGSGTNRYAFRMNGYVVKVATDHDGKIDNLKEMKMAKRLFPDVTKVYEVTENGTLLVAEYIQPFQSFGEMQRYADKIKDILRKISQVYLIGDVGIDSKNYANWGLRVGSDDPVCLDFAYVYDARSDIFICHECNTGSMLCYTSDYTELICPNPACGHKYRFEDIRGRMSNDVHMQEIGDLSQEAYKLAESNQLTELTPERSNYLKRKEVKDNKESKKEEEMESIEYDNFIFEKEENTMVVKGVATLASGMNIYPTKAKAEDNGIAFSGEITTDSVIQASAVTISPKEEKEIIMDVPKDIIGTVADLPKEVVEEIANLEETESVQGEVAEKYDQKEKTASIYGEIISDEVKILDEPITEEISELPSTEAIYEPNFIEDTVKEEPVKEEPLPDSFKENVNFCLKKLAEKIQQGLYQMEIWDEVRMQFVPANAKPKPAGTFYNALSTSIFQALSTFLGMHPIGEENGYKVWGCDFKNNPAYPTLKFMANWYSKKFINTAEGNESIQKYREFYKDEYPGIQREWTEVLRKKMLKNMKQIGIEKDGYEFIINTILDLWCVPEVAAPEEDIPVDQTVPSNDEVSTVEEAVPVVEETTDDDDMLAFSASVLNRINSTSTEIEEESEDTVESDEDDDDDEDEEEMNDTEVLIYPDTDVDIIRCKYSDTFGNIEIPLYKKLSDINPDELIPSMADDRNGNWDWLIHIVPDMRFLTDDPNAWLALNTDDMDDLIIFVILDPDHNGHTLMGMYAVSGIFTIDDNGITTVERNREVLKKLNILFKSEIGTSAISHYIRNISDDELIRTEEYAKSILAGAVPVSDTVDEATPEDEEDEGEELGLLNPFKRIYN